MKYLKYVFFGASAVYGLRYATKKRDTDGKSLVDDFKHHLDNLFFQAKDYGKKLKLDYKQTTELY